VAVGSLRRGQAERSELLGALGALWVKGYKVAWEKLFPEGVRRVELPTYAWQRQRYWVEEPPTRALRGAARDHTGGHPLMGESQTLSTQPSTHVWETTLDPKRLPWLADHRVEGAVVFPGAGYVEMALAAGAESFGGEAFEVLGLTFVDALVLSKDGGVVVQVVTTEMEPGRQQFQVACQDGQKGRTAFRVHARGVLRKLQRSLEIARVDVEGVPAQLGTASKDAEVYKVLSAMGLAYGPAFQGVEALWRGDSESWYRVRLPEAAGSAVGYKMHPALFDACLHGMVGCFEPEAEKTPWIPVEMGAVRLQRRPAGEIYTHVRLAAVDPAEPGRRRADLVMLESSGEVVAEVKGLVVQQLGRGKKNRERDDWYLGLDWEVASIPGAKISGGGWLLLGSGNGLGSRLGAALKEAGQTVVEMMEPPLMVTELREVLTETFAERPPIGVVHLGSLNGNEKMESDHLERSMEQSYASVLATVQALVGMGNRDTPRLWMITRGAQAVGDGAVCVEQAPLLGLGRTIAFEHTELRCGRLDLDPACPVGEERAITAELLADDAEDEVALRGDERLVGRLIRRVPESGRQERPESAQGRPYRLEVEKSGALEKLVLRETQRRAPGPGEVAIEVEAAAMGSHPGSDGSAVLLGEECAGRVVEIGDGVPGLQVGDHVMTVTPGSIGSYVTVSARLVVPRPAKLSSTQAAALPIAYMTAWYGLLHLGRLSAGERVLIHSATESIGLAAVYLARHLGAQVFATADSEEKRAWLRSQGVEQVMDSRLLDFAAQVMEATSGEGVDVVLNSLAGSAIEASLSVLAQDGRFIELGKTDIYSNRPLGLAPFKKSLSYSAVDLASLGQKRPERFAALLQDVTALLGSGALPALPVESLPISRAAEAFRKIEQAQHIGKLVLSFTDPEVRIQVPQESRVSIRAEGSYLVTGGLGGLGLIVARWLAEQGAGQLVLVGRAGAATAEQQAAVADLTARGTQVMVARADVAERAQLESILHAVRATGVPLRGIVHAAGLLDDGLLMQQTAARFRTVLRPKAQGAWNLHELTREDPLDFFVMYASAAGLLGSPGQGNYAAANTFLDALAHLRRADGLPALSIDWGAISDVGLAVAQDSRGARLASRGMRSLTPGECIEALGRLLQGNETQVGVVPLNLRQWGAFHQVAAASRRLSRLRTESRAEAGGNKGDRELLSRLAAAEPHAQVKLLAKALWELVAQVLRLPEGKSQLDTPLTNLGMDSLMALELRNQIEAVLGIRVPATLLWTYPTVTALSPHLSLELGMGSTKQLESTVEPERPLTEPAEADPEASELSDDQLLEALRTEL
jgi:NADPH:quinone reductase-like Zn-dependent oxidoreductase/acyl carrier protein